MLKSEAMPMSIAFNIPMQRQFLMFQGSDHIRNKNLIDKFDPRDSSANQMVNTANNAKLKEML